MSPHRCGAWITRHIKNGSGFPVDVQKALAWYESAIALAGDSNDSDDVREARAYIAARDDRRSRVREPEKFPWGGLRRLARLLGLKQMAEKNKDGERLLL